MNKPNHVFGVCLLLLSTAASARACTSFLITKGASVDGSNMITYAADAHVLYGELYHTPAATHLPGEMLDVFEWDTGKFLGQIPQVEKTYTVVGNMNEHQVAIGETTWGGRSELRDPKGILDYGSLMYIGLQRAKTARELITVMTELVDKYGYYSSGESMSICDPNEVWILEIIGKGPDEKGAVWVARKVPDGYVSGHANAPRIRQFPLNDSDTIYAKDAISFARKKGYFSGPDSEFSFADAYGDLDYGALRFCDARVWCMYTRVDPDGNYSADWPTGRNTEEPMPLWIKPKEKLGVRDVMQLMRDHFEGTELDMTADIGAGPYQLPYRWRPLTWKHDGKKYLNERATSTQQTGFSFVAQARDWLPAPIGGILWFGMDDTYSTVYAPMYCGITDVPTSYAVGTGNFDRFSWDSAFWTFNFVANYTYLRYADMIKDVQKVQRELEGRFVSNQARVDAAALALHKQAPHLAVEYLTKYSIAQGEATVQRWRELGEHLIWKYLDGNVRDEHGNVTHPGYPKQWYETVAAATGERLVMKEIDLSQDPPPPTEPNAEQIKLVNAIGAVMTAREMPLTPAQRGVLEATRDIGKLEQLLIRAAKVQSVGELIGEDLH